MLSIDSISRDSDEDLARFWIVGVLLACDTSQVISASRIITPGTGANTHPEAPENQGSNARRCRATNTGQTVMGLRDPGSPGPVVALIPAGTVCPATESLLSRGLLVEGVEIRIKQYLHCFLPVPLSSCLPLLCLPLYMSFSLRGFSVCLPLCVFLSISWSS